MSGMDLVPKKTELGTILSSLLSEVRALSAKQKTIQGGNAVAADNTESGAVMADADSVPQDAIVLAVPSAPQNLHVDPDTVTVVGVGANYGSVGLDWDDVDTDIDGSPIDVQGYEVFGMSQWEANPKRYTFVEQSIVVLDGLEAGLTYEFQVRAVSVDDVKGPFSDLITAEIEIDAEPPPKPSTPIVVSTASVVSVSWDGLDFEGNPMPDDLRHVVVRLDTSTPPEAVLGYLTGQGTVTVYQDAGTTVYAQMTAEDFAGNIGEGSAIASHVVHSVLDDTGLGDALENLGGKDWHQDADPGEDAKDGDWWYPSNGSVFFRLGGVWVQKQWSTLAIADSAISVAKLGSGSVTRDKISPGAVGSSEIADFAIAVKKLNNTKHYLY